MTPKRLPAASIALGDNMSEVRAIAGNRLAGFLAPTIGVIANLNDCKEIFERRTGNE
jgi:hypothetical protein